MTLINVASPTRHYDFLEALDHAQRTFRPERIQFVDAAVRRIEFGVTLTAGNCYHVTVTALQQGSIKLPHVNYRSIGTAEMQFKAGLDFWRAFDSSVA